MIVINIYSKFDVYYYYWNVNFVIWWLYEKVISVLFFLVIIKIFYFEKNIIGIL